jgi:acetyl-CoA acyltransferase
MATTRKTKAASKPRRAVVVAGNRTPFVRAFKEYTRLDTIALGVEAVNGLLARTGLPRSAVEAIVWGGVILPGASPNTAREVGLDAGLPKTAPAFTVSQACASGLRAVAEAASIIERGEADVVIAGGGDSTSGAEVKLPQKVIHALGPVVMGGKAGPGDWLGVVPQLWPPGSILPTMPKVAERSTGEVMGEAAEKMAARNGITREAQDAWAASSHHKAAAAIEAGIFDAEITPVAVGSRTVHADTIVRGDTTVEKMAKLRSAFARKGTLTAANSSALTDGAAAVLVMEERAARAMGLTPLAAFRSWGWVGVDPADQLLLGPALAMPQALARAGMELADVDLVDMHEAFAAQVLAILKLLASDAFARERLGRDKAVGEVDLARMNVHGGSLALGHPFAATGARMVTTVAHELARSGRETALLGICAAGGLGAAAVLEAV